MRTRTRTSSIETDTTTVAGDGAGRASSELLAEVDSALQQMVGRGLVDSLEVVDLLLDLRSRIVLEEALAEMTSPKRLTNGV